MYETGEIRQHPDMTMKTDCVQLNSSPLRLHGWADQYLEEYRELPQSSRGLPVAWMLLCRAMEIEFKAWHRQVRGTDGLIDRFQHDLVVSYRALPKKHQTLSLDEVELLRRAGEAYGRVGLGFLHPGAAGRNCEMRLDPERLEALTQKLMEYGDRLDLALI